MTKQPYDITALCSLRDRCVAATGSDRELDAEICATFRILPPKGQKEKWLVNWDKPYRANFHKPGTVDAPSDPSRVGVWWEAYHIASSVDIALALLERALPGWHWDLSSVSYAKNGIGKWAKVWLNGRAHQATAPSAPLALLIALLDALIKDAITVAEDGFGPLCSDCPPAGYPTDKTRCACCPRRAALVEA